MMQLDTNPILDVFSQFSIETQPLHIRPIESGHINDTYLVVSIDNRKYILQRLNTHVFRHAVELMNNIDTVTTHILNKLQRDNNPLQNYALFTVSTDEGMPYYIDAKHNFWRLYNYIEGTHTYDHITKPALAEQGGKAFGRFIMYLDDIDPNTINDTIPNFHNLHYRWQLFKDAIKADAKDRFVDAVDEVELCVSMYNRMLDIQLLGDHHLIPQRIVHNDTKINNVLFNKAGNAVCVIDLDTIMPGYLYYDFSDAIRTGCCSTCEDEENLDKVHLNLDYFEAFCRGFLRETKAVMSLEEKATLGLCCSYLPFIIGLRFLTDYLAGDVYFKIHDTHQNLRRARTQLALVKDIFNKQQQINTLINENLN